MTEDTRILIRRETAVRALVRTETPVRTLVRSDGPAGPPGPQGPAGSGGGGGSTIGDITGLQAALDALTAAEAAEAVTRAAADSSEASTRSAADALKAPLASPALTGTPTAPTAAPGTATTQLATTAFVDAGLDLKADLTHVNTVEDNAVLAESQLDARLAAVEATQPTAGEFDALTGTSGTPSATNKYVTNADPRLSDTRTPTDNTVGTSKVVNNAVTDPKLADMPVDTIKGRATAGTGDPENIACTAAARALLDDPDAAAQRSTLGLGTVATQNVAMSGDLAGNYPSPTVAAVHETGGPTKLTLGAIADGDFVKRSGSTLIGGTPAGGSSDLEVFAFAFGFGE